MTPVERVEPGDAIQRPSGTTHLVTAVETVPAVRVGEHELPERVLVVYRAFEETTPDRGVISRPAGVLRSFVPLERGQCVPIVRGGNG
jgi:hypothetical protein